MSLQTHIDTESDRRPAAKWIRRLTWAGFGFFLLKGLFWVVLAVWAMA